MDYYDKIQEAKIFLEQKGILDPEVGVVLGTGLNELIHYIDIELNIAYSDIPHFPVSTVEFHKGKLIYGKLGSKKVLLMQGRFHAYEGYTMQEITFPVRVMKMLGIKYLFLSNAAGGINLSFKKGNLVLIKDHINLLTGNPLSGKNLDTMGPRFPDMSEPYDPGMRELLLEKAAKNGTKLLNGVYAAVHGPNLETKAEYRFLKIIGADLVGMSTVPEVIVASHMKLPCIAVSVVTDECDPDNLKPVNIEEIIEVAGRADKELSYLFAETIKDLS